MRESSRLYSSLSGKLALRAFRGSQCQVPFWHKSWCFDFRPDKAVKWECILPPELQRRLFTPLFNHLERNSIHLKHPFPGNVKSRRTHPGTLARSFTVTIWASSVIPLNLASLGSLRDTVSVRAPGELQFFPLLGIFSDCEAERRYWMASPASNPTLSVCKSQAWGYEQQKRNSSCKTATGKQMSLTSKSLARGTFQWITFPLSNESR